MISRPMTLNDPWLVAVWPGIGNVAISAGYYLLAKLGMTYLAQLTGSATFEANQAQFKDGMIQPLQQPSNRLFIWYDPAGEHDIIVFIGETRSQSGDAEFCRRLVSFAKRIGVTRVFTFAAVATLQILPDRETRVFGVVNHKAALADLNAMEVIPLTDGQIGGMNAVLLSVAAEADIPGIGLLGEIPRMFLRIPCPKTSLAILKKFKIIAGIDLDLTELTEHSRTTDVKVSEILERLQAVIEDDLSQIVDADSDIIKRNPLNPNDARRIEELFDEAENDRAKAFELKRELDRLNAFELYEIRFLDLFGDGTDVAGT